MNTSTTARRLALGISAHLILLLAVSVRREVPVARPVLVVLHTFRLEAPPQYITPDDRTGRIFVNDGTGVQVFDAYTGSLVASVPVGDVDLSPVVDERFGRVFVGTFQIVRGGGIEGSVSMLDARSGRVLRTVAEKSQSADSTIEGITADPATDRVFITWLGGYNVLDERTGAVVRTVGGFWPCGSGAVPCTLGIENRRVFISGGSTVRILNGRTAKTLRMVRVGFGAGVPLVDERTGDVFVGSRYRVNILDARSGALLHATYLRGDQSPGLYFDAANQRLYVTDYDYRRGVIDVIDARSDALLRAVPIGSGTAPVSVGLVKGEAGPLPPLLDTRTNRAFILNSRDDVVTVLDLRSEAVLGRIPVGFFPQWMLLDQRRGRLFISVVNLKVTRYPNASFASSLLVLDTKSGHILQTIAIDGWPTAPTLDEATGRLYLGVGDSLVVLGARGKG